MKKTKRQFEKGILGKISYTFLCLIMLLQLLPVQKVQAATITPVSGQTIDYGDGTNTTVGSITIHKYEYNGAEALPTGSGSSADETYVNSLSGAKPLKGAGFTLYRIVDADDLQNYYKGLSPTPMPKPTVSEYVETNGDGKAGVTKIAEKTTGADGTVTFSNLPLGMYLVIETTPPAGVTKAVDPFIVSIPMTKADGKGWMYDVDVYPKNTTSYGGITIRKVGLGGNGLNGVYFVLQKLVSESPEIWENVINQTKTDDSGHPIPLVLNTAGDGSINVEGIAAGTYRFIEQSVGDNDGYIMDGEKTYVFSLADDGAVSTYDIVGGTPSPIPTDARTITANNYKPSVKKEIVQKDNSSAQKVDANYSVGDTITYKVDVAIPENITKLKEFSLKDTPSEKLEDSDASIDITYSGVKLTKGTNYTVSEVPAVANTSGKGFQIDFKPSTMADYAGKTITITYTAKLLENAKMDETGNKNTIDLKYSNRIAPITDYPSTTPIALTPTPPATTIKDETVVYTFQITITKQGDSGTLKGAEFALYGEKITGITDSNLTELTSEEAKKLGLPNSDTKTWVKIGDGTTDGAGKLTFDGVSNGTYYLVETKAPEGYNLLDKPVEVKVGVDYTTATVTVTPQKDAEGNVTVYVKQINAASTTLTPSANDNSTLTIKNAHGFTLPTTGGAGGFLFTLAGCGIMIVGIVIFRKTRSKKTENA